MVLTTARKRTGGVSRADSASGALGMRQILCVTKVAEVGNVTRAAALLRKSQGAVSKAVAQAERVLGARLFTAARGADPVRSAGARAQLVPTNAGQLVVARFRAIEALAAAAAREHDRNSRHGAHEHDRHSQHGAHEHDRRSRHDAYDHERAALPPARGNKRSATALHFLANASTKRLQQLVALLDLGSIEAAAARLTISRDAIYKSMREAEHQLDVALFHHLAAGRFVATPAGRALLLRIKLMLAEMRHVLEDVAELRGRTEGRLTIGCLPSMASHIVPEATAEVLRRAPQLSVALVEGSYDELMEGLQSGEIDVIVGGLAPARDFPDVRTIPLIDDRIVIFGRAGHPLARRRKVSSSDLKSIRWVLPMRGSIAKPAFESLLSRAGIRPELPIVENASIVALNGLLATSDMLTVGSALQMQVEAQRGVLQEIPFRLTSEVWQTGIVLRESTVPSPAARVFIEALTSRARAPGRPRQLQP
jgi:LysR family transcriptional regulator of gallate degradation